MAASFDPQSSPDIEYVLSVYNTRVAEFVAMTMVVADLFPKEILNEIRSSFTHLAKASALEYKSKEYLDETKNALRHLKRASLDCLKVSILVMAEKTEHNLDGLTSCLLIPENVLKAAAKLRAQRKEILGKEAAHPSSDTIDKLEALFLEYDDFNSKILSEYGGERVKATERRARRKQILGTSIGFLLGVISSVIASYLYDILKTM